MTFCREKLNNPEFLQSTVTSRSCIYINNMFDMLNSRNCFPKVVQNNILQKKY